MSEIQQTTYLGPDGNVMPAKSQQAADIIRSTPDETPQPIASNQPSTSEQLNQGRLELRFNDDGGKPRSSKDYLSGIDPKGSERRRKPSSKEDYSKSFR